MGELLRTKVKINGQKGIIVHDKLCSDGPVDPVTGEPLLDPSSGQKQYDLNAKLIVDPVTKKPILKYEPYPGPNDDMADLKHEYLLTLCSTQYLKNQVEVSRFGVLTLLAMNTPIFVYDHPAFKKIANTAFTDGRAVFIDADFMRKLVKQEEESGYKKSGVLFLILHELLHKLYSHTNRLKNYPPMIANIAEDMVINGKLIKGFPTLKPVPLLMEIGYGMKDAEAEKFHNMSEEIVAESLWVNQKKKEKKEKQKKSGSGGGAGDEDEDGSNDQQEGDEEEYSPIHHITPEELIDIIEKHDLHDTVGKALNLPKKGDKEGLEKMNMKNKMGIIDAIQNASVEKQKAGDLACPGQHINEYAESLIKELEKGKLTYKLLLQKYMMGQGTTLEYSDDQAELTYYLDKNVMNMEPFYSGSLIPHQPDVGVYVLIDTSGSTSGGTMRKEFAQEAVTIAEVARKVFIQSADTALRGEPQLITRANIDTIRNEGIPVFGEGGTSFKEVLKAGLAQPLLAKENIKAVIYFTDCIDEVPQRADFEEFLIKGIKIVFVTTPGMFNETWNKQITWAEVVCIEDNAVVDFTKTEAEQLRNTRTKKNKF